MGKVNSVQTEVHYRCAVFSDLERHSEAWHRLPRDRALALVGEYRSLAERVATQYGCVHRAFTGDGHLFLFDSPDAGVQFGLRLVELWHRRNVEVGEVASEIVAPLRVGCHYGECARLEESWVGRGIVLAKRVEGTAASDCVHVTESLLDLIDLPLYRIEPVGAHRLAGDHLEARRLYRLTAFEESTPEPRPDRPMTAEDWFLRAAALVGTDRENTEEEAEAYRTALELRPDYPEAHNNLAILLRRRGELAEGARHYREALRLRPEYPEAHYNYGLLLAEQGRLAAAKSHYRAALDARPDYFEALHALANLSRATGDLDGAEEHYRRALELRSHSPEVHSDFAVLLEDQGEPEEAIAHYRRALELAPGHPQTHYNYALLLERRDRGDEAEEHYRAALATWPDYVEAHNNLAVALHERGELAEAEEHYRRALALRPDDSEAHHNYGLLLRSLGRSDEAEEHLRTARELSPDRDRFRSLIDQPD